MLVWLFILVPEVLGVVVKRIERGPITVQSPGGQVPCLICVRSSKLKANSYLGVFGRRDVRERERKCKELLYFSSAGILLGGRSSSSSGEFDDQYYRTCGLQTSGTRNSVWIEAKDLTREACLFLSKVR